MGKREATRHREVSPKGGKPDWARVNAMVGDRLAADNSDCEPHFHVGKVAFPMGALRRLCHIYEKGPELSVRDILLCRKACRAVAEAFYSQSCEDRRC